MFAVDDTSCAVCGITPLSFPTGMQTLLAFINDPAVDPVLSADCLANMKPVAFGQDGTADAAEALHYPELDMSDPFVRHRVLLASAFILLADEVP